MALVSLVGMYARHVSEIILEESDQEMTDEKDADSTSSVQKNRWEKIREKVENNLWYIILFFMSTPNAYAGFMTLPFLIYLIILFVDFMYLPARLLDLLVGETPLDTVVIILGLVLLVLSVRFLSRKKQEGLVTLGVYRRVRHPQYLGVILFTAALTSKSIWILLHTFGIGFLSPQLTLLLWFPMVVAYIGLAVFEERHLKELHQEAWVEYKNRVGFLLPFVRFERRAIEISVTFVLLSGIMFSLLLANGSLWALI